MMTFFKTNFCLAPESCCLYKTNVSHFTFVLIICNKLWQSKNSEFITSLMMSHWCYARQGLKKQPRSMCHIYLKIRGGGLPFHVAHAALSSLPKVRICSESDVWLMYIIMPKWIRELPLTAAFTLYTTWWRLPTAIKISDGQWSLWCWQWDWACADCDVSSHIWNWIEPRTQHWGKV